jgi:uncharacterized membrane protein YeaQ/YmgE (transglycosylase-associated protein family)
MSIVWLILIGMLAGWLAGQIMQGSGFGVLGDIVIGVLGAILGGVLFNLLQVPWGGLAGRLVVATIGAILLIFIVRLVRRGRR